jgi:hydrogenase nickel incorporation protein HypA/HybF
MVRSLLAAVLDAAGDATRVDAVCLTVGDLAGVTAGNLLGHFSLAAQGTIAESAELVYERVPGAARCLDCLVEYEIDSIAGRCPICGSGRMEVTAGEYCGVAAIAVED